MSNNELLSCPRKRLAVLIDGENISASHIDEILKQIYEWGQVGLCNLYNGGSGWEDAKKVYPFELCMANNSLKKADAAVFLIYLDAMEICLKTEYGIDGVVLVSSDCGFYQLALRLRRFNKDYYLIAEKDKMESNISYLKSCSGYKLFDIKKEIASSEPKEQVASSPEVTQKAASIKVHPVPSWLKGSLMAFHASCTVGESRCKRSTFVTQLSKNKEKISELKNAKKDFLQKFIKIDGVDEYFELKDKNYISLTSKAIKIKNCLNLL